MVTKLLRAMMIAATLCVGAVGAHAQAQKSFVRDDLGSESVRLQQTLKTEFDGFCRRQVGCSTEAGWTVVVGTRRSPSGSQLFRGGDRSRACQLSQLGGLRKRRIGGQSRQRLAGTLQAAGARSGCGIYGLSTRHEPGRRGCRRLRCWAEPMLLNKLAPISQCLCGKPENSRRCDVRTTYEGLRAEHGFRVTDMKVDSDSGIAPCLLPVLRSPRRWQGRFHTLRRRIGRATAAVTAEASQLCVDGLKHSERYAVVLRQGLPSAVGETLLKAADYEVYVRDRAPQARFTGRNYVLPSIGQEGIPVVSVNTAHVDVEVYRIGDRNLLPTVRSYDFLGQITRYSAAEIARDKGMKIWNGTLDTGSASIAT